MRNFSIESHRQYKEYRNYIGKLIKKQKNAYYAQQVLENKNNIKHVYKVINEATNEAPKRFSAIQEIINETDKKIITSASELANYCNKYFIQIGDAINSRIEPPSNQCIFQTQNPLCIQTLFLNPVTENEIINIISSLKNTKSKGHDGISSNLLKLIHKEISKPLAHVINLSFQTGKVPSLFKVAVVTPIYKSGDKRSIGNYRPISVITSLTKIFEKCFNNRMTAFLSKYNLISTQQYGSVRERSTTDAMYKLVSTVMAHLNNKRKCITAFLDLEKAFDTVSHAKLMNILPKYGIRGTSLKLVENYLEDRFQVVKINGVVSEKLRISTGIPQGTVLGPTLFLLYINSLLDLKLHGEIIAYADDTAIVFEGETWEEVKVNTTIGIKLIMNWLGTHKLKLNINKTKYISFSLNSARTSRPDFNRIVVNEKTIEEVQNYKYLGCIIDEHLKWKLHAD